MHCIHLALAFLSLSVCHREARPRQLPGLWVGTLEVGRDRKVIRVGFTRARSRVTGALHVAGVGEMTFEYRG